MATASWGQTTRAGMGFSRARNFAKVSTRAAWSVPRLMKMYWTPFAWRASTRASAAVSTGTRRVARGLSDMLNISRLYAASGRFSSESARGGASKGIAPFTGNPPTTQGGGRGGGRDDDALAGDRLGGCRGVPQE